MLIDMTHQSNLTIEDGKKVDVAISLMSTAHQHVAQWHTHAFNAATWSMLIILSCVLYSEKVGGHKCFLAASVLVFTVLAQIYLHAAHSAIHGNGCVIATCQDILHLTAEDAYFKNEHVFPPSTKWVRPVDVIVLRFFHAAIGILATAAIMIFH